MPDIEDVKFISHSFISWWEIPGLYTLIYIMGKSHCCSNSWYQVISPFTLGFSITGFAYQGNYSTSKRIKTCQEYNPFVDAYPNIVCGGISINVVAFFTGEPVFVWPTLRITQIDHGLTYYIHRIHTFTDITQHVPSQFMMMRVQILYAWTKPSYKIGVDTRNGTRTELGFALCRGLRRLLAVGGLSERCLGGPVRCHLPVRQPSERMAQFRKGDSMGNPRSKRVSGLRFLGKSLNLRFLWEKPSLETRLAGKYPNWVEVLMGKQTYKIL